ncbi:MAG TPA: hypothetical protein VK843_07435, partial [Planctomycetota bacterium]|nr:hypothetical protein [Planctomycetota bacterium]
LVNWDLISDGAGGCVLAFTDTRAGSDLDVYAYRVGAAGQQLWGANGVALSNNAVFEADPAIARTSDGSFVFAWANLPSPGPGSIRLQKLDGGGNPQYIADGLLIAGPNTEKPAFSSIVASDAGSYIVSWVRDTSSFGSARHVRSQKFDAAGNALWNAGSPVLVFDASSVPIAHLPLLVSDGAGGALYGWHRATGPSGFDVLVQHVNSAGSEVFAHNGVSVCNDPATIELDPALAWLPASGDLIVAFDKRNSAQSMWSLSVQRISAAGALSWGSNAIDLIPIDNRQKSFIRALPFGNGALVFCFNQAAPASQNLEVLGFRIDGLGASTWTPAPLPVSSAPSPKGRLSAATDASGIARLVWGDGRSDISDTYAQNVNPDATLGNSGTCGTSTYCTVTPNSAGPGALIGSNGSTSVALNNLELVCSGLPLHGPGLFTYSAATANLPLGNGTRCIGGTIVRLNPGIASNNGFVSRALDLTAPPASSGPGMITPGSTWYFQYWYRDIAAGGAFFNLSNGLKASFCP